MPLTRVPVGPGSDQVSLCIHFGRLGFGEYNLFFLNPDGSPDGPVMRGTVFTKKRCAAIGRPSTLKGRLLSYLVRATDVVVGDDTPPTNVDITVSNSSGPLQNGSIRLELKDKAEDGFILFT